MKKRFIPICLLIFFLFTPLFSEDYFRILSGEGRSFSLVRGEVRQELDVIESDLSRILIGEGDYLITGEGTFLELACGDILLMVGENSALSVDSLNLAQGSLLTLTYGRVHGKKTDEGDRADLWIGGEDTVARLKKGDIGVLLDYDMTLAQPEILTRIYSLEGTVEIMQKLSGPDTGEEKRVEYREPVLIDSGEMVVSSSWEKELPLIPSLFDADYAGYWKKHPFSGEIPPQDVLIAGIDEENQVLTEEIQEKVESAEIPERDWEGLVTTGKAAFVLGAVSMAGGALSYMAGSGELGNAFTAFSFFNLGIGTGVFTYTWLSNPAYGRGGE